MRKSKSFFCLIRSILENACDQDVTILVTSRTDNKNDPSKSPGHKIVKWWARPDSNREPKDYESPAPPLSYGPARKVALLYRLSNNRAKKEVKEKPSLINAVLFYRIVFESRIKNIKVIPRKKHPFEHIPLMQLIYSSEKALIQQPCHKQGLR